MNKLLVFVLSCLLMVAPVSASENADDETATIRGQITWTDSDNQDGLRPYAITMHLMDGTTEVETAKASVVNDFKYKFVELPDTHYTVEMDDVEGYEIASSSSTEGKVKHVDFTAIHTKTNLEVEGVVNWDDDGDRDGLRPEEVEIKLMDGEEVVEKAIVSASTDWKCDFKRLNKFDESREIEYTLDAKNIDGYKISSGKLSVKFTHKPATTDISGKLVFDDNNNQDGTRPETVTINLMEGDKVFSSIDVSARQNEFVFEDVPKNRKGEPVAYTLQGADIEGYTVNTVDDTVTYTHGMENTSVSGTITWKDNNDEKGERPASVRIILYKDGKFLLKADALDVNFDGVVNIADVVELKRCRLNPKDVRY